MGFCLENLSHLSTHQFEIFIRQICQNLNYFYEDYMEHKQGVFFESLYITHISQCSKSNSQKFCFCSKFTNNYKSDSTQEINIERILGQEFRQQFILNYISNLYSNYLNQVDKFHKKQIEFSYLSFLIEKSKNKTKSLKELFKIQQEYSKNKNWTNLIYIKNLINRASSLSQNFEGNKTNENQTIKMHDPITFDFLMTEFKNRLKSQILKQIEYFKYLCSNYFNLEELMNVSKLNLKQIQNVRTLQKLLYDIHPNNLALNSLSQIFQSTLDFYSTNPKKLQNSKLQNTSSIIPLKDLFSPQSCSIYCSLINKTIDIKRTSLNFSQIFETQQVAIIGKQVSNLLPKDLFDAHELTMDEFINLGNTDSTISQGERFVFAINGNGFIFPINIRIKVESIYDDFGVTAFIKKVNDQKQYIFFNELFQITDISHTIYQKIFSQEYSLNQLKNQLILNFIPLLDGIFSDKSLSQENYYNSCLLLKRRKETSLEINSFKSNLKQTFYVNERMFSLVFRIRNLKSQNMKHIKYLEIENFAEEKSIYEKRQSLNLLSKCLDLDFQLDDFLIRETQENDQKSEQMSNRQDNLFLKLLNSNEKCKDKNQEYSTSFKVDSKIDLESQIQLNIQDQQSNTNFGYAEEETNNFKRNNSQNNYYQSNSASKKNQCEQQIENLSSRIEINSFQNLQSSRPLNPHTFSNLTSVFKNATNESEKQKINQKSSQFHKEFLSRQLNTTIQFDRPNQECTPIMFSVCNYFQNDKSSGSPESIIQNHKSIQAAAAAAEEEEEEEEYNSYNFEKQIKMQPSKQNISEMKLNKLKEEEYQHSLNESQSSSKSIRKSIIKKITQNTHTKIIRIIIFTGLMSIALLQTCALGFYFININNLISISNLFKKFNYANLINESVYQFLKEQGFYYDTLHYRQILDLDRYIINPQNSSQIIKEISYRQAVSQKRQRNAAGQFSKNINQILKSQDEEFFQYISETEIATISDFYDQVIFTRETKNNTILYTMLLFSSNLNQLYLQGTNPDYYPESVVYANLETFNSSILKIQVMIYDQLINSYQWLKDIQQYQLIQILVSCVCLIAIALPFLFYFNSQQYQILKLLGSFPPSLLQSQISLFYISLNHLEQLQKKEIQPKSRSSNIMQQVKPQSAKQLFPEQVYDKQNLIQFNNKNGQQKSSNKAENINFGNQIVSKRQRQIASFKQSRPFKLKYIMASLLVAIPFMIQPIYNLVSVNQFVDESTSTLTQRQILFSSSQYILNFEVVHYKIWETIFYQPIFDWNFFYQYGKNITQQSEQVLGGIKNITHYETSSRYEKEQRKMYFSNLLEDNLCNHIDIINNSAQQNPYFKKQTTSEECQKLLSKNFERGFILAFQYLTNLYRDWFQIKCYKNTANEEQPFRHLQFQCLILITNLLF
ncbi:transmembrane protein, putative (macronuclear) [Tetrahymena thermophila SB210]|uniref:Transmembrane protein, putative n=1 Tax=Tetrahymena thermophila (strain SB210) TaxID=312017 RepID=Q23RX2_TETTS|nr:transmembrane protein, putative [Tetrahymena thermophila SB210]EAR99267.2 transmembrane protein, putative [Tetrahymena thermophila SB210]|eukprot:XP_001019512.2 transmembrane protein, putative [Tetrahymena thermophila SB210]